MKTFYVVPLLSAVLLASALAQAPRPAVDATAAPAVALTPNDGFWLRGNTPVMTHKGITTVIDADIFLPNGMRIQQTGAVGMRDGTIAALLPNQLLTFDGKFVQLPAAMQTEGGTTPVRPDVSRAEKKEVGLSGRDGITVSGTDVFITRNGVTDKVTADVKFPNGVVAKPDGSIMLANGEKVQLRPDQLLDLNGVLRNAPPQPNPAGPAPASSGPNPQ